MYGIHPVLIVKKWAAGFCGLDGWRQLIGLILDDRCLHGPSSRCQVQVLRQQISPGGPAHLSDALPPAGQQFTRPGQPLKQALHGGALVEQPGDLLAQVAHPQGGQKLQGRVAGCHQLAERLADGLLLQLLRLLFIQDLEEGVDPGRDGVFPQDARAQAVDGADLHALQGAAAFLPG